MKILCKLPNAAEVINGVKFITHKLGVVSEEIEDEVAEHFLKIPGYVRFGAPAKTAATSDATTDASTAAATAATAAAATAATPAADAATATAATASAAAPAATDAAATAAAVK
jgi:hypothetical protein